jgi:DNA-binding transcriptional LysR family regulator
VSQGEVDLAFSTRKPERPDLTYVLWKRSRIVAIVPVGHALAKHKQLKLTEMTEEPLVLLEPDNRGDRDLIETSFHRAGVHRLNVALECSNSEIIAAYVESGLGIGLIAETSMAKQRRKVVAIPVPEIPERSEVGLLVRAGQFLPHRSREFIRLLDPVFHPWLQEYDQNMNKNESEEDKPREEPRQK